MKIRTKAKIRFIDLVRPDMFWPYPYSVEQSFMVFFHMARTARKYAVWKDSGPVDTLNKQPTCQYCSTIRPIESLADLKERFVYALLCNEGTGKALRDKWREETGIGLDKTRWLAFPHLIPFNGGGIFRCEADIKRAVDDLLAGSVDRPLSKGPDGHRLKTPFCHGCHVCVGAETFSIAMKYGNKPVARFEGQWTVSLADSEPGEPFVPVLERAMARFETLSA